MPTKLTIPVSNTWNAAPTLYEAGTGRFHCVYWYDDGAGNEGLWHTYLDDFVAGWDAGQALTTNAPGPQAGASLAGIVEHDAASLNPGRISVYFGDDANGDLYETYSDDDGLVWSTPALFLATIKSGSLVKQVAVIQADTGRWVFAVIYDNAGGGSPYDVYTFYSDDEGVTTSTPVNHSSRNRITNHPQVTLYQIRYGKVVLAAVDDTGDDLRIVRSKDRGATWETIVDLYINPASVEINPSLTQLFTGELLCAFETDEDLTPDIKLVRSSDEGFNWGTKTLVYSSGSAERNPSILPYTRDTILCAFDTTESAPQKVKMVSSTDQGATWGSKVTVSSGTGDHQQPHMTRLANGDILCSYRRVGADNRISVVRSTDGGATWGSEVDIDIRATSTSYPFLFQVEDGTILCAFAHPSTNQYEVSRSSDNGVTWDVATIIFTTPIAGATTIAIYQLADDTLAAMASPRSVLTSSDGGLNWTHTDLLLGFSSSALSLSRLESGRYVMAFSQDIGGSNWELYAFHSGDGKEWEFNEIPLVNVSKAPVGVQLVNGTNLMYLYDTVLGEPIVMTGYDEDALEWDTSLNHIVGVRYVDAAPTDGIHNAILTSSVLYAYTDWGGASSALYSLYAVEEERDALISDLESFTGLEAPQNVLKWEYTLTQQATDTDGETNIGVDAFNFESANGAFTTDVEVGDRLIIENATPSAVDGVYVIVEVTDDTNIKVLNAFGSSVSSLDYRIVRNMADMFELRRKELEYPVDRDDGNRVRLNDPVSDQDDPFFGDPGEGILIGTDGLTVATNTFNSATGGFSGVVNIGDELTISDSSDLRNNDVYIVTEVTDDNNIKAHRDFPVAAVGSLDFDIWHGPRPFATYYYSLFLERINAEPLLGRDLFLYQTWSFAGGSDASDIYATFKTRLFETMPKVYRERDANKETSAVDQVIEYGEVIYRDDASFIAGHMERLARLVGLFLQRSQDLIDNYPVAWDVNTAPPPVLIKLAESMGLDLNQQVQLMPVHRWRKYVEILAIIFQRKGTLDSVRRIARFYGYELAEDDIIYPLLRGFFDSATTLASGTAGASTNPNIFSDAGGGFSSARSGDWLWILDATDERDNGIYEIKFVVSDTQIILEQNFPVGGIASLDWTVFGEVPFDQTFLDSFSPLWRADLVFFLLKDGVYQLWAEPDTQFVVEEITKVSPFYFNLIYNEEVP